ncbi:bifunctional folylpolyglutamate synthase/dihydrofolate synthase [Salirhabdus salicampi]|uniref:bifunctional folylpolyglutamate synthase/dihydrofolate synthase n=1 Tax=Salirhabdus salicampi TaxID=476102 RepID=UPI0020C20ED5|nr:folylpolyglutamate synthase/dihydrofolate synthase family protein [Salirhabdus salicampi]MCP8617018.1 bifunctional folylpolyglutamate synthase/dihydrofolate synthase [Salirhabdus salicampi]
MNKAEAIDWLHSRLTFGIKPGLKRMEWFMEKLGHPEKRLKAIHIAGTNGKGSTLSYIRNLLQAHHYEVGTFTSPYITEFNERISINGQPIKDDHLIKLVEKMIPLCNELAQTELGEPTEFEVITAMAFDYFATQSLDYVIFETGLGGRLDSTNVVLPLLTVITNIGLDHTAILGDSYEQIAAEKAGILKRHIPLITAVQQENAREVIRRRAWKLDAPIEELGLSFSIFDNSVKDGNETFRFQNGNVKSPRITIQMKGEHQVKNAAVALQTFFRLSERENIQLDWNKVLSGMEKTKWPGRFELIHHQPTVILDGAHNEEGLDSLIRSLERYYHNKNWHIIFSAMKDKPLHNMIAKLDKHFSSITFTTFPFPRAADPGDLACYSHHEHVDKIPNWERAIQRKIHLATEHDITVVSGSLYFVSEIRRNFEKITTI